MPEPVLDLLNALPLPPQGQTGWPWLVADPERDSKPQPAVNWPRLSIITPSYNQALFLEETIRSVLLQGYPNLEYIIVDGGSQDESVGIIQKYEPWLSYWVSEPDEGQSQAIHKGLQHATGKWVGWLNSDDLYLPGALFAIAQAILVQPEATLIFGDAQQVDIKGHYLGPSHSRLYDRQWLLSQGNSIPQPAAFFGRDAFDKVGGLDESLHFAMDYDLWFRLGDCGPVHYLPQVLASQRIYDSAKTSSGDHRHYREVKHVIERYGGQGLPLKFQDWLLQTHLPLAFAAYARADAVNGQKELAYILDNLPLWQTDPRPLAQAISAWAWRLVPDHDLTAKAGFVFVEGVGGHLPMAVAQPNRVRHYSLAMLHEALAFRAAQQRQAAGVWTHTLRAFQYDTRCLMNRGLWSILVRSCLYGVTKP